MITQTAGDIAYRNTLKWIQGLYDSSLAAEKSINRTYNACESSFKAAQEDSKNKVAGSDSRLERSRASYNRALKLKETWWVVNATLELALKRTIDEGIRANIDPEIAEWIDDSINNQS